MGILYHTSANMSIGKINKNKKVFVPIIGGLYKNFTKDKFLPKNLSPSLSQGA